MSQIVELTQRKFCDGTEIQLVAGNVAQPKFQQLNEQSAQSTLVVQEDLWQMLVLVQNLDRTHHQIEMEQGRACWAWLIRCVMKVRCESMICSNERGEVCVLFMRRRGGEEGGRRDGDHHKQLLVTVEVSES